MTLAGTYDDGLLPTFSWRRVAAPLLAMVLLAGCSGDGGGGKAAEPAKKAKDSAAADFGVTVVSADVQAMSPQPPPFPEDVKAAVGASLDNYLENAVVVPLRSGKPPAAGLDGVFTAAALGRLSAPGADRAALFEEGAPLSGKVRQDRADAALTALTGPGGEVVLVTARLDVAHTVTSRDQAVALVRSGELVLVPSNGWLIDAYDIRTARDTQPRGAKTGAK